MFHHNTLPPNRSMVQYLKRRLEDSSGSEIDPKEVETSYHSCSIELDLCIVYTVYSI